jgi:hypothetical protein
VKFHERDIGWFVHQDVSLWQRIVSRWVVVTCPLIGHRYVAQWEYYPGAGTHFEGDLCERCWKWRP